MKQKIFDLVVVNNCRVSIPPKKRNQMYSHPYLHNRNLAMYRRIVEEYESENGI